MIQDSTHSTPKQHVGAGLSDTHLTSLGDWEIQASGHADWFSRRRDTVQI